jgi:BarA-like signal transduction histidine kinase
VNGERYAFPGDSFGGLTKRELFAAMAMQGILSGLPKEAVYSPTITANASVCHADALLAELAKPQEPTP